MSFEIDLSSWSPSRPKFALRDYQQAAYSAITTGWETYSRQLLDMATGSGKTSLLNMVAADAVKAGGRALLLQNRDQLVRMSAKRVYDETGIECEIEMAGEAASPFAPIVVASVPTLARVNRLTSFSDSQFDVIISDECHHSLSPSYSRTLNYFHYGAQSLDENWSAPDDGTYTPIAKVLGVTATPQLAGRRQLGEFYQHVAYTYSLHDAVRDGWLVPPLAVMEPLPVNLKGLRARRGLNGLDYNPTEVAERMVPIIDELAKQMVRLASDRKTMAFMPSVKTASMLADALNRNGLQAIFVSGECLDRDEKTDRFIEHGPGIALTTAAMYVEGFDCLDVDCVFAGITRSAPYYRQKIGRATRPLKGIVDGLETAAQRRAAIAASAKPNFLIIDPFCRCDDIDLCDAYDLYADKPEIKARMKELGEPTAETAKKAERDFVKSIEKEARRAAKKASRVIDPLAWGLMIGDQAIAHYVPQTDRDKRPVTEGQKGFFVRHKIDQTNITCFGLADKIIGRYMQRINQDLAPPHQLKFLIQLGLPEEEASKLSKDEATRVIEEGIGR
jgi:superfamily II DNA or RNA helicase